MSTTGTGGTSASSDEQSFDYIIVGAGPSAMGLLAGLLQPYAKEDAVDLPFSIAIIERGPAHGGDSGNSDNKVQDLSRWFEAAHDKASSHVSILPASISTSSSRHLDVPLGQGVGGGSNINAGLCMAPPPSDFEGWPSPWQSDLPACIQKLQQRLASNHCLLDAATGEELTMDDLDSCRYGGGCSDGLWKNNDMSINHEKGWKTASGRHSIPCLARRTHNGVVERVNYYQGLIEPLLLSIPSKNIHWFYNAQAQRLLLEDRKVIGVEVMNSEGNFATLLARKEVILCAGAMETPALLLVSGIGNTMQPDNQSKSSTTGWGNPDRQQLPALREIGQNLRDHVILPRVLLGPPPYWRSTINGIHHINDISIDDNRYLIMTSTTTPEIALHYMVEIFRHYFFCVFASNWFSREIIWWTLEHTIRFLVLCTPIYWVVKYGFTAINLALVNPQSKGTIGLTAKSDDPSNGNDAPPRRKDYNIDLDLGYLQHPKDIEGLWQGWVASSVVFDSLFYRPVWEVYPGRIFRFIYSCFGGEHDQSCLSSLGSSDPSGQPNLVPKWFSQYAHDHCLPFFHWCGTCAMKTSSDSSGSEDNKWVVDATLRVRSFQSLRICDASVFPTNLSVPPALACAAMGHVLANIILRQDQE